MDGSAAGRPAVEYGSHTWSEVEKMAAASPIAVLPSGAFEVYGPHLPAGLGPLVRGGGGPARGGAAGGGLRAALFRLATRVT